MNGDEKPNNDVSRDIHIGVQVGIPEKVHRFTFSDFRKQSRAIIYGRAKYLNDVYKLWLLSKSIFDNILYTFERNSNISFLSGSWVVNSNAFE